MEISRPCRIALVGPDAGIVATVLAMLRAGGHACEPFADGGAALREIERAPFDLLLVAGTAPRPAITALLTGIHARLGYSLPVIGLGAAGDTAGAAAALDAGMDHILAWPAAPQLLLAQVNAALRRAGPAASGVDAAIGHLVFRREGMRVHVDGALALVTAKEYALGLMLCRNLGKALDREQIFSAIWGDDTAPTTRTLDVHISRLRSKLLLRPDRGFRLTALYGRGYRLDYGAESIAARATPPLSALPRSRPAGGYRPHAR